MNQKLYLPVAALGLAIAPLGLCQSPAFEVASIKPNKSTDNRTSIAMMPGGRFNAENVSVKMLMTMAYDIKNNQIVGGPSWMSSEHYDILAKPEGQADQDKIKLMIQALLSDRFQLKFHKEMKEQPVYALVVDKGGSKLKESTGGGDMFQGGGRGGPDGGRGPGRGGRGVRMGRGQLTVQGAPLSMLASQLAMILGRQVIDKTGLTANYDFTLKWTPDENQGMKIVGDNRDAPPSTPSDSGPSIFTALQEQLGLKLESQRGPVEIYTIDHIERASEN